MVVEPLITRLLVSAAAALLSRNKDSTLTKTATQGCLSDFVNGFQTPLSVAVRVDSQYTDITVKFEIFSTFFQVSTVYPGVIVVIRYCFKYEKME